MTTGRDLWAARTVAILAAALVAASLMAVPAPRAGAQATACPEPYPVESLRAGMMARGLTVERGYQPTEFDVEILGVLTSALGPGKDLVIIEASGPMLDRAGGIWAGMSGSPVYLDGKLVGAVAYGLSFGPSKVGGVTPALDMLEILDYPSESSGSARRRVAMNDEMRRTIARETGVSEREVGGLERLMTPVSMSGVTGRALGAVKETLARENAPFIPYTGSSHPALAAPSDATIAPGDSFGGALSYGDITVAGVGTATFVCDGKVVAFGHPFFFNGSTTLGANAADALTIVDDPTFGPYKLATIGSPVGTIDQDRFSGVRATLGAGPSTIPIDTTVTALDGGKSRSGQTRSVLSDFMPFLTFFHALLNIDTVIDRIGEGSAYLTWRITGTTESGLAWELNRSNRYASRYDISFESLWEILEQMFVLQNNTFEKIAFTGVDLDAEVEETVRQYTISGVTWSLDGTAYHDTRRVKVHGGETLLVRAVLTPYDDAEERVVDLTVTVPRRRALRYGGRVHVFGGHRGGFEEEMCFYDADECGDSGGGESIDTFEELIASLEARATNDLLSAEARAGRRMKVKSSDAELLDQVVSGFKSLRLRLAGAGRRGEPIEVVAD